MNAAPSPQTLAAFRNRHRGETIIVCGCGESLNLLPRDGAGLTIGVNDVGRRLQPTYLVVLNPASQFSAERFAHIRSSRARYVFSQLPDLPLAHASLVRFRLGKYAGTDLDDSTSLPYTRNSPYVAVCLAVLMGASHVGLIGVDFTEQHFFAHTGRHPLSGQLAAIDAEYRALACALAKRGVELVNLSPCSRLSALDRVPLDAFLRRASRTPGAVGPAFDAVSEKGELPMNERTLATGTIAVEKHDPGIVGSFLDAVAATAGRLGWRVTREPRGCSSRPDVVSVVWNGRTHQSAGPTLFCEHAWLPRWDYQVSFRGINADSHLAPFVWDGRELRESERRDLQLRLAEIRATSPPDYSYMRTDLNPVNKLPEQFFLVPLQMEWDTNIQRHVPAQLRSMQAFVDHVSASSPPFPILFKQHPADVRRGGQQLRLRLHRSQDRVHPHNEGNIHQLLKSGRCRGIISLNSNAVHDGLLWDVPSIVLGRGLWPRVGATPFLVALPGDWAEFEDFNRRTQTVLHREAYAHYVMKNQWTLDDARSDDKVAALLAKAESRAGEVRALRASFVSSRGPSINVVAKNRGWFFEDLKRHFAALRCDATLRVSESPRPDSDAWIFIRTKEARWSPDPRRTLVQIHDMFDDGAYLHGGERRAVIDCAALALTHPEQAEILERSGISLDGRIVVDRPIGYREIFRLRMARSPRFTIAWVGRPVIHKGVEIKRVQWLVDAARALRSRGCDIEVVFLGEDLEAFHRQLAAARVHCRYLDRMTNPAPTYPRHYAGFDCVVITSCSDAGPLCLFEALSAGVPVVSTRVGWSPRLIVDGRNGYLVDSVDELTDALERVCRQRDAFFGRRASIRESVEGWTQGSWLQANIDAVLQLIAKCPTATIGRSSQIG